MKKTQTCLLVGVLIVFGIGGYRAVVNQDASHSNRSIADRLANLEEEQDRQYEALSERIDRLAGTEEFSRAGAAAERPSAGFDAAAQDDENMTPQQVESGKQQAMQRFDEKFESQTMNSKWSLESTRAIENTLTAESLAGADALPPAAQDIQCRSSMCRIQLTYADSGNASVAGMMINAAIADRMPYTHVSTQPGPGGSVVYVIYAMWDEITQPAR